MDNNKKSVSFGTKQEAIITPKEGYEVESVTVVNTADNSVIPSELKQNEDTPTQWICSFLQPAAHVLIKPVTRPILYSVSFEISDEYTVVLVESDSMAEIEIKTAASEQDNTKEKTENTEPENTDFNKPQHSFNEGADGALDVGDENNDGAEDSVGDLADVSNDNDELSMDAETEEEGVTDVPYDAGEFSEELEDFEPVVISQKEYSDKNNLFWSWKKEYNLGKCSEEKFASIQAKHLQWIEDINAGKIIVK